MTRAIVADDYPMCREAARIALIACLPDVEVVEAATLHEVLCDAGPCAIIILDLGLPDSRGVASLIDVARHMPATPILVVSGWEDEEAERQVAANGAAGFVSKTAPLTALIAGVRAVCAGERHFSPSALGATAEDRVPTAVRLASLSIAEARVLRAMRGGDLNKQIAYDLNLSEITIKQHVKAILRKLEVVNRTQAVLMLHDAEAVR